MDTQVYTIDNNKVIVYHTKHPSSSSKKCMYYFICQYILEDENTRGFCYYCGYDSNAAKKISKANHRSHLLCDECVHEWYRRKNDITQVSTCYYTIHDSSNLPIQYTGIYFIDDKTHIVYSKMIISINMYNYNLLSKYPSSLVEGRKVYDCELCYYDKYYNDHANLWETLENVCPECLTFSLKLLIDKYYKQYMFIKNIMVDIDTIIIFFYILIMHTL